MRQRDLALSRQRLKSDLSADIKALQLELGNLGGDDTETGDTEAGDAEAGDAVAGDAEEPSQVSAAEAETTTGESSGGETDADEPEPRPADAAGTNNTEATDSNISASESETDDGRTSLDLANKIQKELGTNSQVTEEVDAVVKQLAEAELLQRAAEDDARRTAIMARHEVQERLNRKSRLLDDLNAEIERADEEIAYSGPQLTTADAPTVLLQPTEPIATINLGSERSPSRVVVTFSQNLSGSQDPAAGTTGPDGGPERQFESPGLPDKPDFWAEVTPLQRSNGPEIAPEHVLAWATRFGDVVMVSVCVQPASGLDAGKYEGDVYLLDSSLPTTRAAVEINAQTPLISYLYLILLLVPLFAIGYVWVNGRNASGEEAWERTPFIRWLRRNFLLAFTLGFGAAWATLQLPFRDETWGSSVQGAAAVVGVSLVSAVTAITAGVGRVRGAGVDYPESHTARKPATPSVSRDDESTDSGSGSETSQT